MNGNFSIDSLKKAEVEKDSKEVAILMCIWYNAVVFRPSLNARLEKISFRSTITKRPLLFSTRLSNLPLMV